MRLHQTLNTIYKDIGLSDMATRDMDKLAEYSTGNFKNFKKDEPIQGFYTGGPVHRGTGPEYSRQQKPRIRPNSGKIVDGKVVYDGGFLNFDNITQRVKDASNWLEDTWLYKGVQTGYNWIKGESGQNFINNLIDRYSKGKLAGGAPQGVQKVNVFQSGAAKAGSSSPVFRAGSAQGGTGTTPLTRSLAQAVANPDINPYSAAYIASQAIQVSSLNLPTIDTGITMRTKNVIQQQKPTVNI